MKQDPYLTPAAKIKAQVDQRLKCERLKEAERRQKEIKDGRIVYVLLRSFGLEVFLPGSIKSPCFMISESFSLSSFSIGVSLTRASIPPDSQALCSDASGTSGIWHFCPSTQGPRCQDLLTS